MADSLERTHDPAALKNALYSDAISEKSEKIGKSLLIVATMALLTGMFDIKAKSAALIPLDFESAPETLGVLLSVLTFFLTISYLLRFFTDALHAREEWASIEIELELEKKYHALRAASNADDDMLQSNRESMGIYDGEPEPWWEGYSIIANETRERISQIEEALGDRRAPKYLWLARFMFFGFSPLLVAVLALSHSGPSLASFIQALLAYS